MDNTVVEFDKEILNTFRKLYPNKQSFPLEQQTHFYIKDEYPIESQELLKKIYCSEGFFLRLKPIKGSLEALSKMSQNHEVFLCTSPLRKNIYSPKEKFEWVANHLGYNWTEKIIIAKDKTMIRGDILIDDRPSVIGSQDPLWEHVLYSQPYNNHVKDKRRITWENWQPIFL